jgi:hypothetical protein
VENLVRKLGLLLSFSKNAQKPNHPMGENSPTLVTLLATVSLNGSTYVLSKFNFKDPRNKKDRKFGFGRGRPKNRVTGWGELSPLGRLFAVSN